MDTHTVKTLFPLDSKVILYYFSSKNKKKVLTATKKYFNKKYDDLNFKNLEYLGFSKESVIHPNPYRIRFVKSLAAICTAVGGRRGKNQDILSFCHSIK